MPVSARKIALAHDSFTQEGGAERVMEVLHRIWPGAPVFTLAVAPKLKAKYWDWQIISSPLQRFYNVFPKLQYFLPAIPFAVRALNFSGFDLVVSSSSGWIKNIRVPKNCVHVNYCHTPARFLWVDRDYLKSELPLVLKPFSFMFWPLLFLLKKWDFAGAQKVSLFLANSKEVQQRILQYYQRRSVVVHPAVNTKFWKKTKNKEDYFLLAGRLQPHKKNEFVIQAFNRLGLKLRVAGTGRQEKYLRALAKGNVIFLGKVSDEQLRDEYSGALGFIYPQVEDFGLMPLEAAACGTATLGIASGGTLETVIPGITGEHFKTYSYNEFADKILNWKPDRYLGQNLAVHAEKFSEEKFVAKINEIIQNLHEYCD